MGTIADSIAAYAQPLLDDTNGTLEEVQSAMTVAQCCWNLALTPDEKLGAELDQVRISTGLNDNEFDDLCRDIIVPMIARHKEMFPLMHKNRAQNLTITPREITPPRSVTKLTQKIGPNQPCPCGSGRKYKKCCENA